MLLRINKIILLLVLALFGFGIYRLFFVDEFYPFAFVLFGTLLSIGVYFSLVSSKKMNSKFYAILTALSLINSTLLFLDYLFPEILKATWNFSFSFLFLQLFIGLIIQIRRITGLFSAITLGICLAVGLLIQIGILFKIANQEFYQILIYALAINTFWLILFFGINHKRIDQ